MASTTSAGSLAASNLFSLKGKVAVVTGGGTGIGLMIARGFADNGAKTYIGSRRKDVVEKAAKEYQISEAGGQLVPIELDVTDKTSIRNAVSRIDSTDGRVDILVNNAGQVGPRTAFLGDPQAPQNSSAAALGDALFDAESFEGWADLYKVNVSSVFFATLGFLGLLEKATKSATGCTASVINVGSISGVLKLSQNHFAYNSSKAAVHHLTKLMSTEFALKGFPIRINAIAPGPVPSEMAGVGLDDVDAQVDQIALGLQPIPAKRAGRDTDMASVALYLASNAGSYVNGQVIVVDGGCIATNPSTA